MILQKLPCAHLSADRNTPPVFMDHHLFTESITARYEYPEHASGLGILSTLDGAGDYFINRQKITLNAECFAVVNHGSKLSVQLSKADTQPAFLFFDSKLAGIVNQSLLLSHEQLLDGCELNDPIDLAYLERVHPKSYLMKEHLALLPRLGDTCSSFHALKADSIIRVILEALMMQNCNAARAASNLKVVKRSTRIELFRRLSLSKEWIEANYALPLTLDQMAAVAMLNSQHFLRMFTQCFSVTPHRFLQNTRLQRSKDLLKNTGEPVTSICTAVGFESLSSFSWLFRQRFGVSPVKFRISINGCAQ